jgi:DNA-binding response OmpR family regulator
METVTGKRVLLVDGDGLPRRALAEQLEGLGYTVVETDSVSGAHELMGVCDLLIVGDASDRALLTELCRAWRELRLTAPIILADGSDAEADRTVAGATFLVRPIRLAELVRKLQETAPRGAAAAMAIGEVTFDPATRELSGAAHEPVRLTEREAAIFAYLWRNLDRNVPRDELLAQVLGYSGDTATHTLETHIYRLRRKLAAAAATPPRLISEDKGYRLSAPEPVRAINDR